MIYHVAYRDVVPIVKSWEWLDEYALRTYLYPLFLSLPLHVLRFLGLDYNVLVVNSVYAMNTLIFAVGDYYLYLLAKRLLGRRFAQLALVYSLFNANINIIFQKTLANGAEAALSMGALYYYTNLTPQFNKEMKLLTLFLTLSFVIRSSSAAGWVPLLVGLLRDPSYLKPLVISAFLVAAPTLAASLAVDYYYYGHLTCPQVNFLQANVVSNLSAHFGTEPWFHYLNKLPNMFTGL